jgi:hypothetical protein
MIPIGTIECETCNETIELTVNHLLESGNYCQSCYQKDVDKING